MLFRSPDESRAKESTGETFFRAKNPDFGACFSIYLKEGYKTKKQIRQEQEKKLRKDGKTPPYPTLQELKNEDDEKPVSLILTITDETGFVIRRLTASASPGIQRVYWDLRYPDVSPVSEKTQINKNSGMMVNPGKYFVSLSKVVNGEIIQLSEPVAFNTKVLNNVSLPAKERKELVAFQQKTARLQRAVFGANNAINDLKKKLDIIKNALISTPNASNELIQKTKDMDLSLDQINIELNGNPSISKRNENQPPSIIDRLNYILWGVWATSQEPTKTQHDAFKIASEMFSATYNKLKNLVEVDIKKIEEEMNKLGSPWTPGRLPEWRPE